MRMQPNLTSTTTKNHRWRREEERKRTSVRGTMERWGKAADVHVKDDSDASQDCESGLQEREIGGGSLGRSGHISFADQRYCKWTWTEGYRVSLGGVDDPEGVLTVKPGAR
jgi:hypothetical protein